MTARRPPPTLGHLDAPAARAEAQRAWATLEAGGSPPDLRPYGDARLEALLDALVGGGLAAALVPAERLPPTLPSGATLGAVLRRRDPRCALLTNDGRDLAELPSGARVGVVDAGAGVLIAALLPGAAVTTVEPQHGLERLGVDLDALIVPLADLEVFEVVAKVVPLAPERFVPAAGQGATALLLPVAGGPGAVWAARLHHRPSSDRLRAERAFAASLSASALGAHAAVSAEGDLTLTAWAAGPGGEVVQATVEGDAAEAEDLGRELAEDVRAQLRPSP